MMKELYDISVLFKMFKRFEKVVLSWKNWEKWAKIGKNSCPRIPNCTLLTTAVWTTPPCIFPPEQLPPRQ